MNKTAILLGSSGLVGSQLLTLLLNTSAYTQVILFNRKPSLVKHPKIKEVLVDFNNIENYKNEIKADVIFSCLGSTKSKTPNLADYRKVDFDIPLWFANEGAKNGIQQYHLVSSIGANSKSTNFYTKLKGEVEDGLKECAIPNINIYQPSFLIGNRLEKRQLESIGLVFIKILNPFLIGKLKKYKGIEASILAKAMLNTSLKNDLGIHTYTSDKIKTLA
jgi:uncharacterized protein YbjT (DUF2867 family)